MYYFAYFDATFFNNIPVQNRISAFSTLTNRPVKTKFRSRLVVKSEMRVCIFKTAPNDSFVHMAYQACPPTNVQCRFLWRNRCCTDFLKKKMFHHYYRKSIQMYYRHKHAYRLSVNVCYFDQILQDQFTMYFRGPRTLHRKIGVLGANVLKTTGLPYLCFLVKAAFHCILSGTKLFECFRRQPSKSTQFVRWKTTFISQCVCH